MKSFEIEASVMVECEGEYYPGSAAVFNEIFGNWLPGDRSDIRNFKVYINLHGKRIDVSDALTKREREMLQDAFIEQCQMDETA